MVCYEKLIFKEIDLIIDSLGIVAFISFFVGGVVAIQTALNLTNPLIPKYLIGFATTIHVLEICSYFYLSNYGRENGFLYHFQYRYYARYRADRCIRGHGCKLTELLSVSQNYCLANVSVLIGISMF
jgi:hypothetical protein